MKQIIKNPGEPMVWLTAMGLGIGLLMVTGLLGFILVRGLEVFWPKRVVQVELKSTHEIIGGEIVLKQTKPLSPAADKKTGKKEEQEWQIFQGNKESIGQSFRFVDEADIANISYPREVAVVERAEYGNAIGFLVRQTQSQWVIRLMNGEERTIPLSQIIHYYYPNQLSLLGQVQLFGRNVWKFLSEDPREANTEGGVFPALFGTLVMTILMSLAVVPFGILAAIYLREYASQGSWIRFVRIAVNNLAGVPSIVFGVFGLGFFIYTIGGKIDQLFFADKLPTPTFGTGGLLWASLTLALMTVPVVIVATEEALAAVSRGIREGALACGASKWQSIQRVILPAAAPGVLTGAILAMARGAGEVAPLMLVGVVKLAPTLPINGTFPYIHLDQKFMHLGFHIYDLGFQSPDSEAARPMVFATTLLLIALVLVLNLGAILLRERLRKKYASGAF